MRCDSDQDLHGHGDAGDLAQGVGHRAAGGPKGAQVGDAVNRPSASEHQEVEAGHGQRGSRHGVDGPQEEEGYDVLQVIHMSSVGAKHTCHQHPAALWVN